MSCSCRNFPSDLRSLLSDRVFVVPDEHGTIFLVEKDSNVNMRVEVSNLPSDAIAIDLKRLSHFSCLKPTGSKRKADYVLVFQAGRKAYVIIFELKKILENAGPYGQQLRRSLPLFQYIRTACEVQYEASYELSLHHVLIVDEESSSLDKQPVRTDPSEWPRQERFKDINISTFLGPLLPFSKLEAICTQ